MFRFYLGHLSPESRQAVLRAEGPGVGEEFQVYFELKSKTFEDDSFHVRQKTTAATGPRWVRSSGNKVAVGGRIWTDFVGGQPFERVDIKEIQDGLDLLWRVPAHHGKGHWSADHGYRELIERGDATEAAQAECAIAGLEGNPETTEAHFEAARLDAKVKRFRTDNFLKHARLPNTVGRMLMALGIIHSNPFSICSWSNEEEQELRRNEESRASTVWDDRIYDL